MHKNLTLLLCISTLGIFQSINGQTKSILMIARNDSPYVILQMESSSFPYKGFSNLKCTVEPGAIERRGDTVIIPFSQLSNREQLKWSLIRDTTGFNLGSLLSINGDGSYTVRDSQDFMMNLFPTIHTKTITLRDTLVCFESRDFWKTLGYSLLPGGGRFYSGKTLEGIGLAVLQVAPIFMAIHYHNKESEYLDRAEAASRRGDFDRYWENYLKSRDYRQYRDTAIGISALLYAVNILDVFINVKGFECRPLLSADGIRLEISKYLNR